MPVATLLIVSVVAFALWVIPITRPIALPLAYLNTHIHELCHALSAYGTGGRTVLIRVYASGSGVALVEGGFLPVVASAGYVGAAAVAGWMLAASGREATARFALKALAGALGLSMLLFVRGDLVGLVSGFAWATLLWFLGDRLKGEHVTIAAAFLGVQQALTSVHSILVLLELSSGSEAMSDARIMQQVTAVPALVWASIWAMMSMSALILGLRFAIAGSSRASSNS